MATKSTTSMRKLSELLDPKFMARLDALDMLSRKILLGKLQGERRSKRRGQSVEFADHRPYVAGDDLWLSMFSGGPRASISVHRDARFDYRPYFDIVEPIFWKYGGRPHWGKVHTLKAEQLSKLYPHFRDFLEMREALDPTGRMLNAHLRGLFGIAT